MMREVLDGVLATAESPCSRAMERIVLMFSEAESDFSASPAVQWPPFMDIGTCSGDEQGRF
jgi:hypothetical protein